MDKVVFHEGEKDKAQEIHDILKQYSRDKKFHLMGINFFKHKNEFNFFFKNKKNNVRIPLNWFHLFSECSWENIKSLSLRLCQLI